MGVRNGVYYWLRQVRPAPHLHAKTSEFLLPSEVYGSQYFKQYSNILWSSVRLNCLDWILLSVCIGQNKPTIIRRIYEDVELLYILVFFIYLCVFDVFLIFRSDSVCLFMLLECVYRYECVCPSLCPFCCFGE